LGQKYKVFSSPIRFGRKNQAYGANCRLQKSDVGPMSQIAGYFSSDSGVYPNPVKDVLSVSGYLIFQVVWCSLWRILA